MKYCALFISLLISSHALCQTKATVWETNEQLKSMSHEDLEARVRQLERGVDETGVVAHRALRVANTCLQAKEKDEEMLDQAKVLIEDARRNMQAVIENYKLMLSK